MQCSNCGSEVREGAKFCRECGSEIVWKTEVLNANVCPKCGNTLEEGALFCNNCGCRIAQEENVKYCTCCNSPLKEGALFCGECGTAVNDVAVNDKAAENKPEKKKDKGLIFLIVLLIVVILGSVCVIGYVYYQNNSVNVETPDVNIETEEEDEDTVEEEEDSTDKDSENINTSDEEAAEPEESQEGYLFPSDSRYITEADLVGKSKDEVAMIRNEIYARHGYIFNTEPFKSYFESREWYVPNENFNESIFSEIEMANKNFLVKYEEDRGWR